MMMSRDQLTYFGSSFLKHLLDMKIACFCSGCRRCVYVSCCGRSFLLSNSQLNGFVLTSEGRMTMFKSSYSYMVYILDARTVYEIYFDDCVWCGEWDIFGDGFGNFPSNFIRYAASRIIQHSQSIY